MQADTINIFFFQNFLQKLFTFCFTDFNRVGKPQGSDSTYSAAKRLCLNLDPLHIHCLFFTITTGEVPASTSEYPKFCGKRTTCAANCVRHKKVFYFQKKRQIAFYEAARDIFQAKDDKSTLYGQQISSASSRLF